MTLNVLSAFRPIGLTALLGDSRPSQVFSSPTVPTGAQTPSTIGGYNYFGWGRARSFGRLKIAYLGGVSGDRSDQMLARLANCYASATNCGHLHIHIGVNDISQAATGYTTANVIGPNQGVAVTASNVAVVCFANIQYAAQQFLAHGGRIVTIVLEPGAENFTATQIGNAIDLNQLLREFAEINQQIVLFDLWKEMHDPTLSSTTTIRFKAGYAQESSGSGIHQSNLGGYKTGIAFGTLINSIFPPVPFLPSDVSEIPSNSLRNLLANPLFVTSSGGTTGAGASGTVPGSWTALRSGGSGTQTVTVSTGTPADGSPGLECILACTFSAAGDIIRLQQDPAIGNVSIGDVLQGAANISVDAGGALAGVYMDFQYNDGTTTFDMRDLFPLNNVAIGTEGYTAGLLTPAYPITAKAGSPFISMRIQAQGSAAGTATIRIRQVQARKRFAL